MNGTACVCKIKEWFEEREQAKARHYNIWFNVHESSRDALGTMRAENGFIGVCAYLLAETEKAVKVQIESGAVDGSNKGWTCWIPKSCCEIVII